jgi:hypothetical protein
MDIQVSTRTGREELWRSRLAVWTAGIVLFETLSGLAIWLLPFSVTNQVTVLVHTVAGLVFLVPCSYYLTRHWLQYRRNLMTHVKLLGYLGLGAILAAAVSGLVLTVQALFSTRISYAWDLVHIVSTFGVLAFVLPHVVAIPAAYRASERFAAVMGAARHYAVSGSVVAAILVGIVILGAFAYTPVPLKNQFPEDYSFKYGEDRPFAPSLAVTETGGAFDPRLLAGSRSCGTAGCHEQIVQEWEPSAHRYAAMDSAFQGIQLNMARQNGPESTRYCGGCHDPISLFSGNKNIYTEEEDLTGAHGYQEGISCLACHAVRETDIKGNAHYVVTQPPRYMFELEYDQTGSDVHRVLRDFLIRSYPREHQRALSKRLFKAPEYCAACHKQFIDAEINNVGWVQLQNQFDNWRMSRWNHADDPSRTIECRECHMPLVDSSDPAAGDASDYNRSAGDGKHRSHRFIAANQMMPRLLKLPGWEKQVELTEQWLRGEFPIPEIEHKWEKGPAVTIRLSLPESVSPGEEVTIKTIITSNKVGHDFPTGPLDIIQSWVELVVTDDAGRELFVTGRTDSSGFIQPGSFILKAEPVDQYGNLIDRHNLWEMVGVRHRRALFPGFADVADFSFFCPEFYRTDTGGPPDPSLGSREHQLKVPEGYSGTLHVEARLNYRKIDQSLLNFIYGTEAGLTSPVTVMSVDRGKIPVQASSGTPDRLTRNGGRSGGKQGGVS